MASLRTPLTAPTLTEKSPQPHNPTPNGSRVPQGPFPYSYLLFPHSQKKFRLRRGRVLSFYLKPVFKSVPSLYLTRALGAEISKSENAKQQTC